MIPHPFHLKGAVVVAVKPKGAAWSNGAMEQGFPLNRNWVLNQEKE